MASKRNIRRHKCDGKKRYTSTGEAHIECGKARWRYHNPNLNFYKCEFCHGYHIGHRKLAGSAMLDFLESE